MKKPRKGWGVQAGRLGVKNMKNEWGGGRYTMDAGGRETDAEEEEEEQEEELALTRVLVSAVGE